MTTNKSQSAPPTWASIERSLPNLGREELDALRRLTAPARHAWRCQQTVEAAKAAIGPGAEHGFVAALIALDLHGLGGVANAGGSSAGTARASWARGLGKGRWNASDGPAWRAAAECSLVSEVEREAHARLALPEEDRGSLVEGWTQGGSVRLPVLAPSVIFSALHIADVAVWSQARGYALHRLAECIAQGAPVADSEDSVTWQHVVAEASSQIQAHEQAAGQSESSESS